MKPQQKYIQTFLVVILSLVGLCLLVPETYAAIQDGDFESDSGAWIENSSQSLPPLLSLLPLIIQTNLVSLPPHSGNWGAWLCGATNEVSSISQEVAVPLGTPILIYWRWIDSNAPCGDHEGEILVDGNRIDHFNLCEDTATTGWDRQVVDLNNFRGQTVTLEIRGNCNSPDERVSNLFLDDFSLQATGNFLYHIPIIFKDTPS